MDYHDTTTPTQPSQMRPVACASCSMPSSSGSSSVFKRREKKYRLDEDGYRSILARMADRTVEADYPYGHIRSLYYDRPDSLLAQRSIRKPVFKEKLRVRSYGIPGPDDIIFVEVKRKFKGVVYKRRVPMPRDAAMRYLAGEWRVSPPPCPRGQGNARQITREITWMLDSYESLQPTMLITYDRYSLVAADDPTLRITFDSEVRWQTEDPRLESPVAGELLDAPGTYLMEVKANGAMPLWLVRTMSRLDILPTSVSKYGDSYRSTQTAGHLGNIR